ncbi:hypothetical protein KFL_001080250 [Klebsormidium nitens]|uniref:Uncharacterized protein n=1 Tax=Klebsormidium nitens TaxID=105231 RepID=A0A1Y1HYT0_KLENI|nr:hypothetical protein KFL_001080250 [Klebsormidium nitens]|eukprot:GAQ82349.1 hypothetical protein KFL_001080250 [Klebsormidium nitens]
MADGKAGLFATAPPLESAAGLEVTELKAEEIQEAFNKAASSSKFDDPTEEAHGPPGGAGVVLDPEPLSPPGHDGAEGPTDGGPCLDPELGTWGSKEGPCIESKGFADPIGTGNGDLNLGPLPGSLEDDDGEGKGLVDLGEKVLEGCGGVIDGIKEKIGDSIFVPADPTEPLPGVDM